jgi:hypothetical protein
MLVANTLGVCAICVAAEQMPKLIRGTLSHLLPNILIR